MPSAPLRSEILALFSETVERCPCCGAAQSEPFEQTTFHDIPLTYVLCAACGLVYQSPRIPDQALPNFYATLYRQFYVGQAEPTAQQLRIEAARAAHLLDVLPPDFRPRLHLDIGCGSGELLETARRRFGCAVVGIEPDDAQRAYAAERGLTVFASLDAWRAAGAERPDLVSLSHVLEHLNDPVAELKRIAADVLAPDGLLLIEVPNVHWHWALEVAHPVAFSPDTLKITLSRGGFAVHTLETHGVPLSHLPLYISAAAQRSTGPAKPVHPARFPRLRRRVGLRLLGIERFGPTIRRRIRHRLRRS